MASEFKFVYGKGPAGVQQFVCDGVSHVRLD